MASRNILFQLLSIIFIFVFVRDSGDVARYAVATTAFGLMGNLSLWVELPKHICKVNDIHPFSGVRTVAGFFLPSVAIQVYAILDKSMLGIILGNPFENGYYEQTMKVVRGLLVFVNAVGAVVAPRIAASFANKNIEQTQKLLYRVYKAAWMLSVPFCLGVILVSDYVVPWFYGPGFEKVALLLKVGAPMIILIGINGTTAMEYLVVPTGRENAFTKALLIGVATNFCLNIVGIRIGASVGAVIASVIAEVVINVVEFWYLRKEVSFGKVMSVGRNYFIAGAAMSVILIGFRMWNIFNHGAIPGTILWTCAFVLTGVASYAISLLALKDEIVMSILNMIKQILPICSHVFKSNN